MTGTVAAVVIHHRRFPGVLDTVRSLIEAGIAPRSLLVMDNSEDVAIEHALRDSADGWQVCTVRNEGYGSAANAAMKLLSGTDVILVVTHEVIISAGSVDALVRAVTEDSRVAAAGPALLLTDGDRVWSRGGVLTRRLLLPRQLVDRVDGAMPLRDVDWLDGSCVAYRADILAANPFREDFFLYFEETELHTRLRNLGWRVVTVAGTQAYQTTQGMPTYWGCRNMVLFQRVHGTRWSRIVAPLYFTARMMGISVLRRNWRGVRDAMHGLFAGFRAPSYRSRRLL